MTILYASFLGGRALGSVQIISGLAIEDVVPDPSDALATLTFASSGAATSSNNDPYNWLLSGNAADFDIRATITSGSFSTGSAGSWLNLATGRTWTVSRTVLGTKSCTATFEISRAGQAVAIATQSLTLRATVE